jgi:hypothetical protein
MSNSKKHIGIFILCFVISIAVLMRRSNISVSQIVLSALVGACVGTLVNAWVQKAFYKTNARENSITKTA